VEFQPEVKVLLSAQGIHYRKEITNQSHALH
jgi:hypothetical protein